jgi:hypothetical protein
MNAATTHRVDVKGEVFGARGCSSCSCDPCDCNPCTCGDSQFPSYPSWRVSGYLITKGTIHSVDVSGRLMLSLAQPVSEGSSDAWQEVLLVEEQATPVQIHALLAMLEKDLESIPAEVETVPRKLRAVYQIPMSYTHEAEGPILHAALTQSQAALVRGGADNTHTFREWLYDGPMAQRSTLELHQ